MTKGSILILGARSDMGKAVAHCFAQLGHPIQLAARSVAELEPSRADIQLRYDVPVSLHEFDVLATANLDSFVEALPELPEVAVCAVGLMGTQSESEAEPEAATVVMRSNFEGPALALGVLAQHFADRGSGTLVGISSVAGERGRASNYVYGSAKAGFTAFLSGMRNRLAKQGVHVVTVLPGFVATQMTEGMDLPKRLTAQASDVAAAIERAVRRKRDVIYVFPLWRIIMAVIRAIPEKVFKGLSL